MKSINLINLAIRRGCLATVLCLCAGICCAQSVGEGLHFSGFGSLGTSYVGAPDGWVYKREFSQSGNNNAQDLDSRLGLQLNYSLNEKFELVGQAILRKRPTAAPTSDSIEWAFAAYRPNADWMLRLGRVNVDAFIMTDHRNVGFAYTYARPPVEFYSQIPTSLDGADLTRIWNTDDALWQAKVFAGGGNATSGSGLSKIKGRKVAGITVSREAAGLLLRISLVQAHMTFDSEPLQLLVDNLDSLTALPIPTVATQAKDFQSQITTNDRKHTYASFGARYERADWLLSGEVANISGSNQFGVSAGYASLGRRFGPLMIYAISSRMHTRSAPVDTPDWATPLTFFGPQVAQQAQYLARTAADVINGFGIRQKSVSVGSRWDLTSELALKVQWDRIRVDANGSGAWANASLDAAHANVGSVMLDFVF